MLNLHGGSDRHITQEGSTTPVKRAWYTKLFSSRRRIITAIALLMVAVGGAVAGVVVLTKDEVRFTSQKEALKADFDALRAEKPGENAPVKEKTTYYDQLRYISAHAGDYKTAVAAFEARVKAQSSDLTYRDYLSAAVNYHRVGDRTQAIASLNKAAELLPRTDNLDKGYSYQGELAYIDKLKVEYSK